MKPVTLRPGIGDDRPTATLYYGQDVRDTLRTLPDASIHTVCTSPPYFGLRDYGAEGQIGLEPTPEEFVAALVEVFREVKRVLRPDGTLWVNLGDSYAGSGKGRRADGTSAHEGRIQSANKGTTTGKLFKADFPGCKPKDLIGIPWMVAFALKSDGWYLRQDIIWSKPSCMPESVADRCTKAHEYVFLFAHPDSKGQYYYDSDAVKEKAVQADRERNDRIGGEKYVEGVKHSDGSVFTGSSTRNKRSVWTVNANPYTGAHFATWPPDLVRPMILAGCPAGGTVLDPFSGSATTGMVAIQEGRNYVGIDLNPDYLPMAEARVREERPPDSTQSEDMDDVLDLFGEDE